METAVALPTLTPLQISFGWERGGKKETSRVGRFGNECDISECVCVCSIWGGVVVVSGVKGGTQPRSGR